MSARPAPTGPTGGGRDRRRFPRFAAQIGVVLRRRSGEERLTTADVSRHGAFVRSASPAPLRQVVQLRFSLPGIGDVDVMCMVARSLPAGQAPGPGFGVDFFALSKDSKARWERFVGELRARAAIDGLDVPPSPNGAVALPLRRAGGPAGGRAPPPPPPADDDAPVPCDAHGSVFLLKLADRAALRAFVDDELERGGFFLKTSLVRELGDRIDVVLVHPDTDEEFHVDGTVVRRVTSGPLDERGLGIFFKALSPEGKRQLDAFVDGGPDVVDLEQVVSARQLELEAVVAREPDSAEALEALGSYLLDEEGDLGGALTALTRALVLGPSVVSIHASLARAYRRIGDHVKERAHERVAEALLRFQDKMKVRMGVGAD